MLADLFSGHSCCNTKKIGADGAPPPLGFWKISKLKKTNANNNNTKNFN
jgi:hypothetical protein